MRHARVVGVALLFASGAPAQTTTYTYDALGRLTASQRSDGFATQYSLDNAGNRTHVTTSGGSGAAPQRALSSSRTSDNMISGSGSASSSSRARP